ncbi:MAG: hypothetical protein IIX87_05015 [Firmicutes bacterium]|nr:hypothetical protein [Bacillota bacterium]
MNKAVYNMSSKFDVYNVDMNRMARPAGMLRKMQECGDYQMTLERPSYDELLDEGKAFMLSRLDLVIHDDIMMNEPVQVYTWPCPSTRATFLRNYMIKKGDEIAAEISSQWTMVNIETRKIMKVDEVDLSNYTHDEYKEVLTSAKMRITKEQADAMETVDERQVLLSDCDYNGHMNNTYSLDLLCDYIPELYDGRHRVSYVRIHFSSEAPMGTKLVIKRLKTEEGTYLFQTYREDGQLNVQAEIGVIER